VKVTLNSLGPLGPPPPDIAGRLKCSGLVAYAPTFPSPSIAATRHQKSPPEV